MEKCWRSSWTNPKTSMKTARCGIPWHHGLQGLVVSTENRPHFQCSSYRTAYAAEGHNEIVCLSTKGPMTDAFCTIPPDWGHCFHGDSSGIVLDEDRPTKLSLSHDDAREMHNA